MDLVHKEAWFPEIMTTRQVARYLGVKTQTVETWRWRGTQDLPYIKMAGGVRYRKADVDAWLEKNKVPAQRPGAEGGKYAD